jgi:hypothetical protein
MGNEPLPFGASLIQNSPTLGATPAKSIGFQQKTLRAKLTSDDKSAGPGFFTRPMRGQAGKPNVARSRRSSGTPSRPCTTPCPCSSSEESAPDARLLAPYACHNALPAACTEDAQAHWQTSLRLFGAIFCCVLAALPLMNSRRDADLPERSMTGDVVAFAWRVAQPQGRPSSSAPPPRAGPAVMS